ncbi:hypothetical protein POM88_036640 [Heracleum sosnowskyi]|uniref:Uncharacterized protein n=1 Tax=Heracleum sosnowskyi TaxID=360622 RepID=A0AAD8MFW1_9APIA|nr:hypothetical protein POM88_036640 [Heracleum sosnowskyi]
MVLREKLQLKVGQREDPRLEAVAFVSRNQGEQRSQMRATRTFGNEFQTCSHCKRQGHDKTRCFELIGYPEHWKNRGGKLGRGRGRGDGGRGFRGAMANAIQGRAGVISNEESTSGNIVQLPSLTQGQLDRLMSLLGTGDTNTSIHYALSGGMCNKEPQRTTDHQISNEGGQSNEEIESDINGADLITENVNSQDNIEDDSVTQEISEDSRP